MLLDFLELNSNINTPMYQQLYEQIKKAVIDGKLKKGEKMPSIREASTQLKISRTTIENAYIKLCIEGIAESRPQRGYYILSAYDKKNIYYKKEKQSSIIYDYSSLSVDETLSDTKNWIKTVRDTLCNNDEMLSYGDFQGEIGLRNTLADYSYKARGVIANPSNIVIGAGIGPLLNIICGLINKNNKIGIENNGFKQGQQIFNDYGIESVLIKSDKNGALMDDITKNNIDTLFLTPSSLAKFSVQDLSKRRNEFEKWVNYKNGRFIIEDDYNGELRYTARSVTAFQGKCPNKTIYIGSFSKLLLPSVRIAYMVLPDDLADKFKNKMQFYNQTCGKIEQLALKSYIQNGLMEKHLRKLRKQYYEKSRTLSKALEDNLTCINEIVIYESSLTVLLRTNLLATSDEMYNILIKNGIKVKKSENIGEIFLCFSGINSKKINNSIKLLNCCISSL